MDSSLRTSLAASALFLVLASCGAAPGDDAQGTTEDGFAEAASYTLWIHGYWPLGKTDIGNYQSFGTYFGSGGTAGGVNKRAVNWGGTGRIAETNGHVRDALDCFCTGGSFCYVAAHSTGDVQIGYALAHYGGSTRTKRDPTKVRADGSCAPAAGGGTQVGWNVKWVVVAGGAAGGSELAPLGQWATGAQPLKSLKHPVLADLNPPTTRALYDHNDTRGKTFSMFVGGKGSLWSGLLPGQDDQVIAFHSAGAVARTGKYCNDGDLMCDGVLTTGTRATSNGASKWSRHDVVFVDRDEDYDHHLLGGWRGVTSRAREHVVAHAL